MLLLAVGQELLSLFELLRWHQGLVSIVDDDGTILVDPSELTAAVVSGSQHAGVGEITSMQGVLGHHQAELSRHSGELSTLHQRSMQHAARLDQHEAGIKDLDDEFADLRRDYPRINPQRQGALLAASGAKALERGDLTEAARCFHLGKATNPIDPAMEYGLAVVMHRQNRDLEAEAAIARGIVLEREHGAQKRSWFVADRFQGPDRNWLESLRRDPLYGVHTPEDLGTVARE
jgi:hypothetical protein